MTKSKLKENKKNLFGFKYSTEMTAKVLEYTESIEMQEISHQEPPQNLLNSRSKSDLIALNQ